MLSGARVKARETADFPMVLSLAQVNRGLTDKALRLGRLGVKTDAKPGQTKEMARDLALRTSGVRKYSGLTRRVEKRIRASASLLGCGCWVRVLARWDCNGVMRLNGLR